VTLLLETCALSLGHGAGPVVIHDLDLEVRRGEIVALVGANASGKSTLLAALGRALTPRAGSVRLHGADLFQLGRRAHARRVARLPQEPTCAAGLTVESLALLGRHPHGPPLAGPSAADRVRVEEALRELRILELRGRKVESLSGGERRRAWLALVLAQDTELLLLDEPGAGLDLRHRFELLELLRRVNRERGVTIVCALHELDDAARVADRVAVLAKGRLVAFGPPRESLTPEVLRAAFGVEARLRWEDDGLSLRVTGSA
jgi:iron complex transport system ATP-binding protein